MRLFYFLAKNISYTFAIALYTSFYAWISGSFAYFIASSFILSSYDLIVGICQQWLPIIFLSVTFLFFITFGFFTPLKIPALSKRHRRINWVFQNNMNSGKYNLRDIYADFSDLAMNSAFFSVIYMALIGISMIAIGLYKFYITGELSLIELKSLSNMIMLGTIMGTIILGMIAYVRTENITNNERVYLYNELLKKGERIKPHFLISIGITFNFFVMIMVLILFIFIALLEKIKYYNDTNNIILATCFVISILLGLFFSRANSRSILKILNDIIRVTREIASGRKAAFKVLSLSKEFSGIEYSLMEMAWEIDEHRKNLELKVQERTDELEKALMNLRIRDDQIQKQLDMASVIQRSMLPETIDDWNELKFSVKYHAMEKIGGDFYDVFQLKDNKIGIIMADVSGHGIPAALVTAMAKISFGNAGISFDSPRRIFQEVNKNIIDHMKTQDYMTCFMVAIDDDYNVTYSNASHQKALLLKVETGEIEYLDTGGLFIGALEEARNTYEEKITKLDYGDRLILYTDGIPEAQNNEKIEYSNAGFEKSILTNRHLPLNDFTDALLNDVKNHMGEVGAIDDITLLIIELTWDAAIDIVKSSRKFVINHKYLEAIEVLENGLEKFPGNLKILYNLSKNYFRVNNYSKAIQTIEMYLQKDKKNKFAYYINGASHFQMMDYNASIEQFNMALAIDSNMSKALFALAMSYKNMEKFDLAIQTFERVINIDSENKMALFEIKQIEKLKNERSV